MISWRIEQRDSLHPGAGTIRPEIISSLITGGSVGGGGQTKLSIISSVTRIIPVRSGGSVLEDRIIMQRPTSSCRTLSKYIISRSLTIAPLITIISSPLMIPERVVKIYPSPAKIFVSEGNICRRKIFDNKIFFIDWHNIKLRRLAELLLYNQSLSLKILYFKDNHPSIFLTNIRKLGIDNAIQWKLHVCDYYRFITFK